ncbi:MAG TPA: radical SAM protein [Chitinophagaceae bacterium]|nr:radical SAM protein [Chitinophagaceae bacterium]
MLPKRKLWVWVDSSNNCNLKCALCYTKASHHNAFLSPEEMDVIMEKIFRDDSIDVRHFTFNWRGEPLMNKNFPGLLRQLMAEKPSCEVDFHTNATLLTQDRAEAIASVAEDYKIFVSIDGGTRESHEKNRGEGNFDKSVEGINNLLRARNGNKFPRIGIYTIDLGIPESEYDPTFRELTKRVDYHTKVRPVYTNSDLIPLFEDPKKLGGQKYQNLELNFFNPTIPQGPCFWVGNSFCISANGDVSICLLSHSREGVVGNIIRDDVNQVLDNAKAIRTQISTHGRSSVNHCKNCSKLCGEAW